MQAFSVLWSAFWGQTLDVVTEFEMPQKMGLGTESANFSSEDFDSSTYEAPESLGSAPNEQMQSFAHRPIQ